jgi:hypothetical protein
MEFIIYLFKYMECIQQYNTLLKTSGWLKKNKERIIKYLESNENAFAF